MQFKSLLALYFYSSSSNQSINVLCSFSSFTDIKCAYVFFFTTIEELQYIILIAHFQSYEPLYYNLYKSHLGNCNTCFKELDTDSFRQQIIFFYHFCK